MQVAYIAPSRNKRGRVRPCVQTMLAQTYSPMHLVFSDQGSTDGTYEEIEELVTGYDGPNQISLLHCPIGGPGGQRGVNAHINWIVENVPADVYILTSIDDFQHPDRALRVMDVYMTNDVSMVNTCQRFYKPATKEVNFTAFKSESRCVSGFEVVEYKIGGSCSMSWTSGFFRRIGGLPSNVISDVYMAYLATQDRGMYYLAEPLHTFIFHPDPNNTGMGGRIEAANGDVEKQKQLTERSVYEILSTLTKMAAKSQELSAGKHDDDNRRLIQEIANYAYGWCAIRDAMLETGTQIEAN